MPAYLALDTETTGLDPEKNAMIEIAAIPMDNLIKIREGVEPFHATVRPHPDAKIDARALHVNGHYWCQDKNHEDYQGAKDFAEAWDLFMVYLQEQFPDTFGERPKYHDRIIMLGWNVTFDEGFLRAWSNRSHPSERTDKFDPTKWPFHHHKLDLMAICRYLDIRRGRIRKSYSLERLAKDYFGDGMSKFAMHTALGDTQMAVQVMEAVEDEYGLSNPTPPSSSDVATPSRKS